MADTTRALFDGKAYSFLAPGRFGTCLNMFAVKPTYFLSSLLLPELFLCRYFLEGRRSRFIGHG